MYNHRRRRASLPKVYQNHSLFRGEPFIDLNHTKGSNAHYLLLDLVENNPKTRDLGSDQKMMARAIRDGDIEDIQEEFPLDWFKHISKIARDFHASKPFFFYFDFPIIRDVIDNIVNSDPPFDKDKDFIEYTLMVELEKSGILKKFPPSMYEEQVRILAEKLWKKYDYTVFFPAEIRLAVVAYYLQF